MKIISTLLLVIFLTSCKNDIENNLKVELLNDTIFCVSNLDYNRLFFKDKQYDDTYNKYSLNIVKYKIHNTSNKKYLIILNKNSFGVYNEYDKRLPKENSRKDLNMMNFNLFSNDTVFGSVSELHIYSERLNVKDYYNCRLKLDTLNKLNIKKMYSTKDFIVSDKMDKLSTNYFIIYPDETMYFRTIINLPLRDYHYDYLPWNTIIEQNKTYQAGLALLNSEKETRKYLTPDLKKEIEENGYTIFDGVIKSNKVPVKLISIP